MLKTVKLHFAKCDHKPNKMFINGYDIKTDKSVRPLYQQMLTYCQCFGFGIYGGL